MKILVVDPDQAFAETLTLLLCRRGHEADFRTDLYGALLELKRDFRPLVIQAAQLGRESGITLLKSLKNRVPVSWAVVLAGKPDAEAADLFIKHGANDFFYKPFEFEVLDRIVRSYAEKWERWQQDRVNQLARS